MILILIADKKGDNIVAKSEHGKRNEEAARQVLRAEGKYNEFAFGQAWYGREEDVRKKAIELFGEYEYDDGAKSVKVNF